MDTSLLVGVGLIMGGIILWKKYDDSFFLWSTLIGGGGVLVGSVEHLSKTFLQLSDDQRIIEFYVYQTVRGVVLIAIVVYGLRTLFSRWKHRGGH